MRDPSTGGGPLQGIEECPAVVTCLLPPYGEERPLSDHREDPPPGSLAILDVEPNSLHDGAGRRLGPLVRDLRRDLAVAVLVRSVPAEREGLPTATAMTLIRAGAAAWVFPGADPVEVAWRTLPYPRDLAGDWIGWMRLHGPLDPRAAAYLECIIREASDYRSVVKLLRGYGISPRTARRVLAAERLPPPGRWLRAARLLGSQLSLQRDRGLTLNAVAFSLDYAEAASYSNQHHRVFGVSAGTGRKLLGREWRYAAFLRQVRENH